MLFDPLQPLQLQDALKCQLCHKQFRSKAGLNYHTMAEHSTKVHSQLLEFLKLASKCQSNNFTLPGRSFHADGDALGVQRAGALPLVLHTDPLSRELVIKH